MRLIKTTQTDESIYAKEIKPFLPKRIFDAHTHLLKNEHHGDLDMLMEVDDNPVLFNVDLLHLRQWWKTLFPDSETTGLTMGFPSRECDIDKENEFVAKSVEGQDMPFAIITKPTTPVRHLRNQIERFKLNGFKPYYCYAQIEDQSQARITDFISEEQIALADEFGLFIMLHVSKPRGMADEENLNDITRLVADYPNCNFILAHCGRCFIVPNMEDALKKLPVAQNLWIDTSAVCDTGVFLNLLSKYDRSRILFGTDLVTATGFRGSYIRLGMSWHPCIHAMVRRKHVIIDDMTTFAAYENLCSFFCAVRFCKLSDEDIQRIFFSNAAELFGLGAAT